MTPDTTEMIRQASAVAGVLAATGLAWRIVGTWPLTSWLTRTLAIVLGAVLFFSAYASTQALRRGLQPELDTIIPVFIGRVAACCVVLAWPWLLRHGPRSRP